MLWSDALGKMHPRHRGAPRIVSLVPSLTELVVALGLGAFLVGRTGFCIHPRESLKQVPKLGGTRGFRIDRLLELEPTHILVNIDENRREEVEPLSGFVPSVIVTHPLTARDNLDLFRLVGGVFGRDAEAENLCAAFEREWSELASATRRLPRQAVVYLIWRNPWISVARQTYISAMLGAAGWDTLPAHSDIRYPEVDLPQLARQAQIVLLSSEPYPFRARHLRLIAREAPGTKASLIDGEMVSWYGSRAIEGLAYLRRLRLRLNESASN